MDDLRAFASMLAVDGGGLLVPAAVPDGAAGQDGGPRIPGGFGWDGGSGTAWRTDKKTGLTGILLT